MNTQAVSITGVPALSSQEIAKLTAKRHSDVMRDIRKTLAEAGIDERKFASVYKGENSARTPCFLLPRFECDLVVSGYSVKYRAAIIRRWHELEAAARKPLNRRDQLLRDLAELDRREAAEGVVEFIRPKHEYGSLNSDGMERLGIRRAAWVARRKSRLEDALQVHRQLDMLEQEMERQMELEFGLGDGETETNPS